MFSTYSSIENDYREKFIQQIRSMGLTDSTVVWVKTEKIHGSNFSALLTPEDGEVKIQWCRRNDILQTGESFHNYQQIACKYSKDLETIFHEVKNYSDSENELVSVQVYGEIFGGNYDHPDVPKVSGVSAVMRGMSYCPHIDWIIYDIALMYKTGDSFHRRYIDYELLYSIVSELCPDLMCMKPEYGTFDELISHSPVFQTTVPDIYGLPKVENNFAEGFVIKPVHDRHMTSGSRVIVKRKNPKFIEVEKTGAPPKQEPKGDVPEVLEFVQQIEPYLTQPRVDSVLSKLTVTESKQVHKVGGLLVQDALSEAELVIPSKYRKEITTALNRIAMPLVVENLKQRKLV